MSTNQRVLLLVEDEAADAGLAMEAAEWLALDGEVGWREDGEEAIRLGPGVS